jgi:protein-ribulosamine 3-kinase
MRDSTLLSSVEAALTRAHGESVRIRTNRPLGGGSINDTRLIDTTAGTFVLKSNAEAPRGMFRAEADGLAALAGSGTALTIPRVIARHDDAPAFLVLEYLAPGVRAADFDDRLGRGLAELHRATTARYGFAADNFCGRTPQPNPWADRWIDFYAEARLGHQVRLASAGGLLSTRDRDVLDALIANLNGWIDDPVDGPSLIHGDLWSGNLHVDARRRPALLDPATYFAHREAELGMMTLFGGFSSRVFAAYDEAFPLDPGWEERNPLYQLYHLLNHLNLFGGGYLGQVMSIARHYV